MQQEIFKNSCCIYFFSLKTGKEPLFKRFLKDGRDAVGETEIQKIIV